MSLLLYCVTEESAAAPILGAGVAGSRVEPREQSGLRVFLSQGPTPEVWTQAPLPRAAREFHRVLQELFSTAAILPFRFPTILDNEDHLATHMAEHSGEYKSALQEFRTSVQMEVLVTYSGAGAQTPTDISGTEYLSRRKNYGDELKRFVSVLSSAVDSAKKWRYRSLNNGVRCIALLEREDVAAFNCGMRGIGVPGTLSVRVSGPWPVTEFLNASE